jgi:hypothetical protein
MSIEGIGDLRAMSVDKKTDVAMAIISQVGIWDASAPKHSKWHPMFYAVVQSIATDCAATHHSTTHALPAGLRQEDFCCDCGDLCKPVASVPRYYGEMRDAFTTYRYCSRCWPMWRENRPS